MTADWTSEAARGVPLVALRSVQRFFAGPPPVQALRGIDLTIATGEYVAILGPSGSGKSTLVNVIGLLDRPTHGQYLLDGVATETLSERDRTWLRGRRIGVVFQSFHLLPWRTAVENVALAGMYAGASRRSRMSAAYTAIERVGLAHRCDALPATMSGGEQQRVAIARALASSPELLLCDEPTGNLDGEATATVLEVLRGLHQSGVTVVIITHDLQVAASSFRQVRILDGRIAADSSVQVGGGPRTERTTAQTSWQGHAS